MWPRNYRTRINEFDTDFGASFSSTPYSFRLCLCSIDLTYILIEHFYNSNLKMWPCLKVWMLSPFFQFSLTVIVYTCTAQNFSWTSVEAIQKRRERCLKGTTHGIIVPHYQEIPFLLPQELCVASELLPLMCAKCTKLHDVLCTCYWSYFISLDLSKSGAVFPHRRDGEKMLHWGNPRRDHGYW